MGFKFRRPGKVFWITIGVIVIALIAFRLALPSIVKDYVNRKLNRIPDYAGRIGDVDIHLWRGAYTIKNVDIVKKNGQSTTPFFSARAMDLSVQWRELFHKSVVGEIYIYDGSLNFVQAATAEQSQTSMDPVWLQVVKDLFPFKINHFEISNGQITFHDIHSNPKVDLFMTNVVAIATNLTNSRRLGARLPGDIQMVGRAMGGSDIMLHVKLDPLAKDPTFDLNLQVTEMNLLAMNDLLEAYAKFNVKRGTFEVYSEIAAENGKFDGYIKPFFKDLDVLDLQKDAKNPLKLAWQAVVAAAVQLFKNHPKDQVATKIPISGTFEQKHIDLWSTIVNVLKNAFVKAFSPQLDNTIDIFHRGSDDKRKERPKK